MGRRGGLYRLQGVVEGIVRVVSFRPSAVISGGIASLPSIGGNGYERTPTAAYRLRYFRSVSTNKDRWHALPARAGLLERHDGSEVGNRFRPCAM